MHLELGTIKRMDDVSEGEHKKTVVEITNDLERSFIEFRGPLMVKKLDRFKIGDHVEITVFNDGQYSKKGNRFNNKVARQIIKV
ncbi:hypothetical protein C7967_11512 [Thalassospira sp. 11-3]|nr:hypothetical protein C7967_11512 [Thalassospira sp. 11-3]